VLVTAIVRVFCSHLCLYIKPKLGMLPLSASFSLSLALSCGYTHGDFSLEDSKYLPDATEVLLNFYDL